MSSIGKRLREYLHIRKLTQEEFSQLTGISKQTTNNIAQDKTAPSGDVLVKISKEYKDINLNWLISGEGEMFKFKEGTGTPISSDFNSFSKENLISLLHEKNKLVQAKEEIVETLKETIAYQRMLINNFTDKP